MNSLLQSPIGRATKRFSRTYLQDSILWDLLRHLKDNEEIKVWEKTGKPSPPPHSVKQKIVAAYSLGFSIRTLVETGTLKGDMVYAMKNRFEKIISIELFEPLYIRAKRRFQTLPHIEIVLGDSAQALPRILRDASDGCLFWLDGHYDGEETAKGELETPVMAEVKAILDHQVKNHVILIDDARLFNGTRDYPTLHELQEVVAEKRPDCEFSVLNDVIRIHPKRDIQIGGI